MDSYATSVRVDRIVLHIGTEKTGASSVQDFLSENRAALAAEGVIYPRFTGPNGGSQWGLVAAMPKQPWNMDIGIGDKAGVDAYRQRLLEAIDEELLACPKRHTLILSNEHFHSRLKTPARLQALKQLLGRWSDNVQVVVYFRRQDRVAISNYSTKLKRGQVEPRAFPPVKSDSLPYYYDYERIYANWTEVFGEEAVQAGLLESQHLAGGDLLTDFCGRVGIDKDGKHCPERVSQSLSETGVRLLLEINRQWPKPHKGPNPSREQLVASIGREHPGRNFPVTRARAQDFYAHFSESNARLAKEVFPDLDGQMFDEDFSDYPEALAAQLPDLSKVVRSRIRAWRVASVTKQALGIVRRLLPPIQRLGSAAFRLKSLAAPVGSRRTQAPRLPTATGLPPVFLHVGLTKTATTTLQNTLFSQHPGICYLGKGNAWKAEKGCASNEIYSALRPILWQPKEPTNPALVRSVVQAHSQLKGSEKPILGSWEGLLMKPPEAFQAMLRETRDVLGDVRLVVTLRNPLNRLPSAYSQALRACALDGRHHSIPEGRVFIPFEQWLVGSSGHREVTYDFRFDFGDHLRFAVELLGRDKVGVFLMEDMIEDRPAFFASLLGFMGIDNIDAVLSDNEHLNSALTVAELEFLTTIEASEEERKRWLALEKSERRLRLKEIASAGNGDKCTIVLSGAQRELIEARSRGVNRWLVSTLGLDLARHKYPL